LSAINIIIPTFRRREELLETVDSLERALSGIDYHVYVINNNNINLHEFIGLNLDVSIWGARVTILDSCENGPCQARNLGVRMMRDADLVWFADDDLHVYDIYPIYRIEDFPANSVFNFCTVQPNRSSFKLLSTDKRHKVKDPALNIRYISGGNCVLRAELAKRLTWDESFTGYSFNDDTDFALQIMSLKHPIIQLGDTFVKHYGRERRHDIAMIRRQFLSLCYLNFKHDLGVANYLTSIFIYTVKSVRKLNKYYASDIILSLNLKSKKFLGFKNAYSKI